MVKCPSLQWLLHTNKQNKLRTSMIPKLCRPSFPSTSAFEAPQWHVWEWHVWPLCGTFKNGWQDTLLRNFGRSCETLQENQKKKCPIPLGLQQEGKTGLGLPCCHSHSSMLVLPVCLDMQSEQADAPFSSPSQHQGSFKAKRKAHSLSRVSWKTSLWPLS